MTRSCRRWCSSESNREFATCNHFLNAAARVGGRSRRSEASSACFGTGAFLRVACARNARLRQSDCSRILARGTSGPLFRSDRCPAAQHFRIPAKALLGVMHSAEVARARCRYAKTHPPITLCPNPLPLSRMALECIMTPATTGRWFQSNPHQPRSPANLPLRDTLQSIPAPRSSPRARQQGHHASA
jgi:hypothetical protein